MRFFRPVLLAHILLACITLSGQTSLLRSGPMVGYSEMREVLLWVQTKEAALVFIRYRDIENSETEYQTNTVNTEESQAFTAKLLANKVEPGRQYEYDLYINNILVNLPYETNFQSLPLWQWRTDPPEFSFATGSGAYINEKQYDRPGKPYGGEYQIFTSIHQKDPDFMIWLGDNVYLREPDWNTWTGIVHRYTHDRATPELQPLLGSVHHYAIWDDHDFGPNDSDRGWWNKEMTLDAFELFWANLSYGTEEMKGAISFFQWGDVDFFMLDNRYHRSPNQLKADDKTMLGKEQLQWLYDGLVSSNANFKFVVMGGQFLNTVARHESYSNYGFDKERSEIISFIYKHDLQGVIFLTGDRHFTELSLLEKKNKPPIYDLTISPFTSGAYSNAQEIKNELRVENTLVTTRNFGILHFKGPADERFIEIEVFGTEGDLLWDYSIKAKNN